MKRKSRKHGRKSPRKHRPAHRSSRRKGAKKRRALRTALLNLLPKNKQNKRQSQTQQKALAALARMRRGLSLARATRFEHIKQSTFLRYVGGAVYRSGPGKPWKVVKVDRFAARMTILTEQGPVIALVHGSRERTRLARYDIALRKWRAGEEGADQELKTFEGQTVAGYVLITDTQILIRLEEAGQLDFDTLYFSVGGSS
jgi:hypothetical protein